MEEFELESNTGYAPPSDKGEIESYRKLGSMKKLTLGKAEAKRVRTLGQNIIEGDVPMVAYIDEILSIQRSCIRCLKYLADGKINYTHKLKWGLKTRNDLNDKLNNPPVTGYDLYADPIEEHICKECESEI